MLELGFESQLRWDWLPPQLLAQCKQIWSDLADLPHEGRTCPAQGPVFGLAEMPSSAWGCFLCVVSRGISRAIKQERRWLVHRLR